MASDPCGVELPVPDECCVSPCDPPWLTDDQCLYWYETKIFRAPIRLDQPGVVDVRPVVEFRIIYEHRFCLRGKQLGPLIYTVTLLPGEKLTLYHSDRFRRITTEQDRFSVQTTFMQFVSLVHEARLTQSLESLHDKLSSVKTGTSVSVGGGLAGLLGGASGSGSSTASTTDRALLDIQAVSEQFNQSVVQASQMTHAERSVVVSTFEEKDVQNVTARVVQNENACRAVTYFVRRVMELYAISTRVSEISYRIVGAGLPDDWRSADDLSSLPAAIRDQIRAILKLLPEVGAVIEQPKPFSLPTDGTVYDPELAHCSSCEPEREAAGAIQLRKQEAEAQKACLEVQVLELELERRRLLLQKGDLSPFEPVAPPVPAPA